MSHEERERELKTLEAIGRVGHSIAGEHDLDKMLHIGLGEMQAVLGAEIGIFCRPADSASSAQVVAESATPSLRDRPELSEQLVSLCAQYASCATTTVLPDLRTDSAAHAPLRSYMHVPLKNAEGTPIGAFCFGHSSAEHFSAYHRAFVESLAPWFRGAIERLQTVHATSTGDNWIATVSHDLRNPLQRICMVSEILNEFVEGSQRELVAKLMRATDSMEKLIEDLVDVVALDNKTLHLERFDIHLDRSLESVCDAKRAEAAAKQVALHCDAGETSTPMPLDTRRIEQALAILLDRAIEATPAGRSVEARFEQDDKRVAIEIRDQREMGGEEGLKNLVASLFPRRRKSGPKPDLGLNIARGIIEAHGGQLSVRAGDSGGITWNLDWPMHS